MNFLVNGNGALLHPFKLNRGISNVWSASVLSYPLSTSAKIQSGKYTVANSCIVNRPRLLNGKHERHFGNHSSNSQTNLQLKRFTPFSGARWSKNNKITLYSCYSQNTYKSSLALKNWLLIILAGSVTGGLLYKIYYSDNASQDVVKEDERQKEHTAPILTKVPASSDEIPASVPYLLIGGGTAAFSAFRAIKALDSTARVLMITNEPYFPYMRPPLTKELIHNKDRNATKRLAFTQWDGSERSVFFEPDEFYLPCLELNDSETGGVCVARGWTVTKLNPDLKYIVLEDGKQIKYDKCLLATGVSPKNLPIFLNSDPAIQKKVTLYRALQDFIDLEQIIENGAKSIAIIGGGFTGSELACSLARRGLKVYQIFKEGSNMSHILPEYLSEWLTSKIENQGVVILKNSKLENVDLEDNKVKLSTKNGTVIADHVIVATGVTPNTDLAPTAFLEVDNTYGGFMVNSELEARRDLFAAGDCASFYDQQLGRRRVEHHDHAVVSGRLAGENMTGARKAFLHQSMFWSDLGPELGYEAVGIVDSSLPTVAVYLQDSNESTKNEEESIEEKSSEFVFSEEPKDFKRGVVFYLKDEKVVGMVMWNIFNRISIARQVLKSNIGIDDLREVAKLFNISKTAVE